jgi:hypothetical protein
MKQLVTTIFAVCLSFTATLAQEKKTDKVSQEKTISSQDKAAAKAKKEADLQEAFKKAELTADEQEKMRTIMEESSAYSKSLKSDTSLSEEQVKAKSAEYGKAKNARIKELLGEAKYNSLRQIQKAQKEANEVK